MMRVVGEKVSSIRPFSSFFLRRDMSRNSAAIAARMSR